MATVEEKPSTQQEPSGVAKGFYKTFRDASEKVSLTAVNLPIIFLEGIGVPADKTKGFKEMNEKFVGGVYGASDWMFDKVGDLLTAPFRFAGKAVGKVRGGKAEKAEAESVEAVAPKKAAPKAAKKAATKKAPKAKKEPPKVAAKEPEPEKEEAKKAA